MREEKIIIKVDENGNLTMETKGIEGPACIEEINKLLDDNILIIESHKTDEYYIEGHVSATTQIKVRRG